MAITIHQQPDMFTPVYNPMRFQISSTNSGQSNFRYVVDVYVSGVTGYTRLLYDADPDNGQCAADVSRIVESYITSDISHTTYGFQRCTSSLKTYEIKFGEQYGVSSGITTYPNLTVTGNKYAWNAVLSPLDFISYQYGNYTIYSGGRCLTNRPLQNYFTSLTENSWLYFLNDTSGTVYYAQVKTYNESGGLIGTYLIQNPYQASATISDKILRFACGTEDLNNATLASGSQPVIDTTVNSYTVEFIDFATRVNSQTYIFTKECTWKGANPITLHFFNALGGYDTFNFRLVRKFSSQIRRDTYQKNLGTLSNHAWSYTDMDRGTTVFNTEIEDGLHCESDWINDNQAVWLRELIESADVYYHNGSSMIPVNVKLNSYDQKSQLVDKLFNISIDLTYANKRWVQRG